MVVEGVPQDMKLFSRASEYEILCLMNVIERDTLDRFSTKDVCSAAGIPEAFARKALVALAKSHILSGTPGPGGGYRLARHPSEVSLLDVVLAVDGQDAFNDCPLGVRCDMQVKSGTAISCATCLLAEPTCGLSHLCPMHGLWQETRQLVEGRLQATSLEEIRRRVRKASSQGTPQISPCLDSPH